MKPFIIAGISAALTLAAFIGGWQILFPTHEIATVVESVKKHLEPPQKTMEELISEAQEKSSNIKGLYMTADVANDQGAGGKRLRENLIRLAETTEINGLVIDVKEVCGPDYDESALKNLLSELHQKNIWTIARIVAFKDASQTEVHPEWYLTRKLPKTVGDECFRKKHLRAKSPDGKKPEVIFWRDKRGGYWLDPTSEGARNYILEFSKKIIDLGFNELQYDYIRFPSDGDVEKAIYPSWDGKITRCAVMKNFWGYLNRDLRGYKPDIILSADFFGYMALGLDTGIGQCLENVADEFDYISFMVYPSHYYSGLQLLPDTLNGLPAVKLNAGQARANPGEVVYRSLLWARNFLDGKITLNVTYTATSTTLATSTAKVMENPAPRSKVRLRPWLEDFFHEDDKAAQRPFGAEKMRLEIQAAEKAEEHGWLLWNAANVYTESALKQE